MKTAEELTMPRYKVIADYPNSRFSVNEILNLEKYSGGYRYRWAEDWGMDNIDESELKEYPHLFKKLEWWEERDFDLKGMFVRFGALNTAHAYYKLIKPIDGMYGFWEMISTREHHYPLSSSFPATESEYTTYISQTKP